MVLQVRRLIDVIQSHDLKFHEVTDEVRAKLCLSEAYDVNLVCQIVRGALRVESRSDARSSVPTSHSLERL